MNLDALLNDDKTTREDALVELSRSTADQRQLVASQLIEATPGLLDAVVAGSAGAEGRLTAGLKALASLPGSSSTLHGVTAHSSASVRKALVRAVAYEPSPEREGLLEQLVRDADKDVRHAAADAVARDPWAGAVDPLLEAVDGHGVPTQQLTAAAAAAASRAGLGVQARVAEKLLAVARSASAQARPFDKMQCMRALDALVRFGATFPGVQEAAKALTSDDDQRTRLTATALLAGSGDRSHFLRLLEASARGSTDESATADTLLITLPAAAVVPALVDAMRHDDALLRARAAELTVRTIFLAREAKVEPLLALTKDPDERVRAAAVASLGRALPPGKAFFGDAKDAIAPALDALASDPSKKVQEALQRARQVLGLG